jgi:4-cresol dehydrogenase (hydroxylating) flavoprotein subunit
MEKPIAMTSIQNLDAAIDAWRACVGNHAVLVGAPAQQRYGVCTTGIRRAITAALLPRSVDHVVAIVDIARRNTIPLYPISTGHNWGYGTANPVTDGNVLLDLSGLDRVVDMDAEAGLVTLEPGVTQQILYDYLNQNGLPFLVPATGSGPHCSLIGNALERGYGITPYADHFGAVTALEAVLPDGRIYRSALSELGGEAVDRSFKWGLGPYLDGLFAQGSFAVVTRMTIALAPRPERIEAFFFSVEKEAGLAEAAAAVRRVLRSLGGVTGSVNLMNARRVLAMMIPYPHGRTGGDGILPSEVVADLARENRITEWTGLGALYGTTEVVRAARRVVRNTLRPVASRLAFVTPGAASRINRLLGHFPGLRRGSMARRARTLDASLQLLAGRPSQVALPMAYWKCAAFPGTDAELDPARDGCGLIWYPPLVPMSPERVQRYVEMVTSICASERIEPLITLTSLSDRCFDSSVPLLFDRRDPDQVERAQSCYRALFEAGRREGFVPYRMSAHAMHWVTGSDAPFWSVVRAIKQAIDPNGIIAPGRYSPNPMD